MKAWTGVYMTWVRRRVPIGCNFRRRRACSTTYFVWSYPRWCLRQSRTVSETISANPAGNCAFGGLPRTFVRFERYCRAIKASFTPKDCAVTVFCAV